MTRTTFSLLLLLASPLAGADALPDLSVHSRATHTPIGHLTHQKPELKLALQPFVERCREAGAQLYERHTANFPYGPEGEPQNPLAQAWYLPGTWHNDLNPNVGITMSVALHTAELPTLSVGHLLVAGREELASAMEKQNRRYIEARGAPALRCDVLIQGLVGTGEVAPESTVSRLIAALKPTHRINRQRISLLLDKEVVITRHEVFGQLHRAIKDKNADMLHQNQAARISQLKLPGATTEVETTWRVHGTRQPGAYLRVKHEEQVLYRCDLKVDGDKLHAHCGLSPNAEIWAFQQLGDEEALTRAARESVALLKANQTPTIEKL
ncbi:hypothetical protein [Ferrimonas balearica]|uniref:hypothetical protein n=1 Tax=Ferrimonas balearica TaxID=44012 RepID=UPI001C992873|nr:hypothetical protein [Ferrimonas balearica]MBY5920498.1 hypothetical protein [Ferrimonas balearica]MBY5996817.1 hypothetical protein [Ferrimonas balearica]